jgi:uncharacterized protein DUF1259
MKVQKSKSASVFLLMSLAGASAATDLDTAGIDSITGLKGKLNSEEGVYKVSQPRTDVKIHVDQWQMPPFMGLTSWAGFQAGMGKNAMVIHHHMIGEQPRTIFLHYWGRGPAADLAEAVKRALGNTKK